MRIERLPWVRKQLFNPDWRGVFLNPFYLARKGLRESILEVRNEIQGSLLDVGCGMQPYKDFFQISSYTGMEIDNEMSRKRNSADIFYDGITFPVEDNSYDSILMSQVLEHVFEPDLFLKEVHRSLKPGGKALITVPFIWDEHEQPWDYARYSSFGLKHILKKHNLQIISYKKINPGLSAICQIFNAYIYKSLNIKNISINFILQGLLSAPANLVGQISQKYSHPDSDLFLDSLTIVKKSDV